MSEVDRLSNSGLYPALPLADGQRNKHDPGGNAPQDANPDQRDSHGSKPQPTSPRPRKSLIDEYA